MQEQRLRALIAQVKDGTMSRRAFTRQMMALGLTAPMAWLMLNHAGLAATEAKFEYKPTKAGGGGPLKMLFWQAPTLLNPHFAVGTKDQEASRIFYEPLAGWDAEGNLTAFLAAELPEHRKWRSRQGRHVGHVETEARREMARRPAVHRRRRGLQLGIRRGSRDRMRHRRRHTRTSKPRSSMTTR